VLRGAARLGGRRFAAGPFVINVGFLGFPLRVGSAAGGTAALSLVCPCPLIRGQRDRFKKINVNCPEFDRREKWRGRGRSGPFRRRPYGLIRDSASRAS
jgi:hypothetical protein